MKPPRATDEQMSFLRDLLRQVGLTLAEAEKQYGITRIYDRGPPESRYISRYDASKLITILKKRRGYRRTADRGARRAGKR